jgi:hypothetical protein
VVALNILLWMSASVGRVLKGDGETKAEPLSTELNTIKAATRGERRIMVFFR